MRNLILGGLLALGLLLPARRPARAEVRTTTVRPGEDCAAIVRRVYGTTPGAMARFHSANPQLGGLPHVLRPGEVVNIPVLHRQAPRQPAWALPRGEPLRLGHVGPGVRTQGMGEGWTEALPDQVLPRGTRIQVPADTGAEIKLTEQMRVQLLGGTTLVVAALPHGERPALLELIEGTLLASVPRGATLLVHTPGGAIRLHGDARIEALGTEARLSVYQRSAHAGAAKVVVPAGFGVLVRRGERPQLVPLPAAPTWTEGGAQLVLSRASLDAPVGPARILLPFATVAGISRYRAELALDHRFNHRRAVAEGAPPLFVSLAPGSYHARISAIEAGFIGPPSHPRQVEVLALRTDAEPVPSANAPQGPAEWKLVRTGSTTIIVPASGRPVRAALGDTAPRDCAAGCTFHLGPGTYRLTLQLSGAKAVVEVEVKPAETPQPAVEPPEMSVPLWTPGFPLRALHPRTRVWALFSLGASRPGQHLDVYRLDLGGEIAWAGRRFSVDMALPVIYQDAGSSRGLAVGDLGVGLRAVALRTWSGHLALGPLLRLQVPTGTFERETPGSRPVVLDPALAGTAWVGPLGLLLTQGPTAVVNLPTAQLRWSMSYAAEVRWGRVSMGAAVDAAIGILAGSSSGASLGGGARVRLWRLRLIGFARGGLGEGGERLFGRYLVGLGAEWVR
ncbi:MAG: hypothetical protein RMK29_18560 [Myxococcales bacterium]|nr:hypothetical protein [Myxococcota bacterium]MDW8283712.1 hypothetical protein [Myxococcales bacterium]